MPVEDAPGSALSRGSGGWAERGATEDSDRVKIGSKIFDVDCYIKDNFCVSVYSVSPGLFGKKKKVCELWHNTITMDASQEATEFPSSQLNIKKKMKKKIDGITIRLGFGAKVPQVRDSKQLRRQRTRAFY